MQRDVIASLRCPYSGGPFRVESDGASTAASIEYGIVSTESGRFPIVAGVLRLLTDESQDFIVDLVRSGRHDDALKASLEIPSRRTWEAVGYRLLRVAQRRKLAPPAQLAAPGKDRLYRMVTQTGKSFRQLVADAASSSWQSWQTYRFSMPTFLPVYPLASLARGSRSVLDFGCGLGHSSFLIRRVAPAAEIVCADYSFTSMYLGKRFLDPQAQFICLDGDYPLPFADGRFDCVFSTDAVQYIEPKIGLAREFQRVMTTAGTIVLAHLHNRLSPDTTCTGKALTPAGYDGLFAGMNRRLYSEDSIVDHYVSNGSLRLDHQCVVEDLNKSFAGVSLVAARTDAVFRDYRGLIDEYIDLLQHPGINPAYEALRSGSGWRLRRRVDAPYASPRMCGDCEILPQEWTVDAPSLDAAGIHSLRVSDRPALRELVRRFIVVDMPSSYN